MKKVLLGFGIIISCLAFSQNIKFKGGNIFVDGKKCMKYDSDSFTDTFKNNDGESVIILRYITAPNDVKYNKVIFINSKKDLSVSNFIFTKKSLFEKLLKTNVIKDCVVQDDKVENFILTYDDKVENRLNNTNTVIIQQNSKP
ncbi:hypothetical protein M2347_003697 [Chryseobacterium sp. H1D6B]|uniref:hypothetical protein n=1 Tax=Chryseobacterium sp. H1D6B TaxID=2940588 RepID=UPI0015C9AA5A|nr:hypothetical protein [Chryseobacterium sp. H1D6B]MDH6253970.1 hypothetical protein [Chryseobacterium sp. H1D6B]